MLRSQCVKTIHAASMRRKYSYFPSNMSSKSMVPHVQSYPAFHNVTRRGNESFTSIQKAFLLIRSKKNSKYNDIDFGPFVRLLIFWICHHFVYTAQLCFHAKCKYWLTLGENGYIRFGLKALVTWTPIPYMLFVISD